MIPQEVADLAQVLMMQFRIAEDVAIQRAYNVIEGMRKKGWSLHQDQVPN